MKGKKAKEQNTRSTPINLPQFIHGNDQADKLAEQGRLLRSLAEDTMHRLNDRRIITWITQEMYVKIWMAHELGKNHEEENDIIADTYGHHEYEEDMDVFGHGSFGIDGDGDSSPTQRQQRQVQDGQVREINEVFPHYPWDIVGHEDFIMKLQIAQQDYASLASTRATITRASENGGKFIRHLVAAKCTLWPTLLKWIIDSKWTIPGRNDKSTSWHELAIIFSNQTGIRIADDTTNLANDAKLFSTFFQTCA